MRQRPTIIGDVDIKKSVRSDGIIDLQISVEGGDSDVAIDTMLLAILQICCAAGVDPKDVIIRTAFRMGELSKTLVIDPGEIGRV